MKTKNWPFIIIALYFIVNIVLVIGVSYLVFFTEKKNFEPLDFMGLAFAVALIMLVCQVVLFDLKIETTSNRPVPKRKITTTSIFIALLMAVLTFCLFFTLIFVLMGEKKGNPMMDSEGVMVFLLFFIFFGSWVFWSYVFFAMGRKNMPGKFISETMAVLMKGSVLELIVAIPSHIIMRNRGDCCAPMFSYIGIITGTTVLLFAFGPGIVFLYLNRMRAKQAAIREKQDLID